MLGMKLTLKHSFKFLIFKLRLKTRGKYEVLTLKLRFYFPCYARKTKRHSLKTAGNNGVVTLKLRFLGWKKINIFFS
jgi:hypothetical protein